MFLHDPLEVKGFKDITMNLATCTLQPDAAVVCVKGATPLKGYLLHFDFPCWTRWTLNEIPNRENVWQNDHHSSGFLVEDFKLWGAETISEGVKPGISRDHIEELEA